MMTSHEQQRWLQQSRSGVTGRVIMIFGRYAGPKVMFGSQEEKATTHGTANFVFKNRCENSCPAMKL